MKQVDLTRLAPPGIDLKSDCKRFYGFLAAAAVFAILVFGVKYRSGYDDLFVWDGAKHLLRPGAVMLTFGEISAGSLSLFYFVALYSLAMSVVYHISYHTGGSKSIYLMRRLPQRWEWLKRDITLPVLGAVLCILSAQLFRLLFLGVYYWVTPAQCLP